LFHVARLMARCSFGTSRRCLGGGRWQLVSG